MGNTIANWADDAEHPKLKLRRENTILYLKNPEIFYKLPSKSIRDEEFKKLNKDSSVKELRSFVANHNIDVKTHITKNRSREMFYNNIKSFIEKS